jgi:hypothetical protein
MVRPICLSIEEVTVCAGPKVLMDNNFGSEVNCMIFKGFLASHYPLFKCYYIS